MKNKVYYGEYSLQHWINLILKKNITLPKYQRRYVWDREKVEKLILALQNEDFVPPVTIGSFNIDGTNTNLILDGQQRLTSILLAYLGLFPNKEAFDEELELSLASGEEDDYEEDDESTNDIKGWTFRKLLDMGKNREDIRINRTEDKYSNIEYNITNQDFFKNTFLGFSYLVPHTSNTEKAKEEKEQQAYFSTVFRSINIGGEKLSNQESRKSLYFLDKNFELFFEPNFTTNITITAKKRKERFDFVRSLALLSDYNKAGSERRVAQKFKQKTMEDYYFLYIYSVVKEDDPKFKPFEKIFPNKEFKEDFRKLKEDIERLDFLNINFTSIIDADITFLGLIYIVLFEKKVIDTIKIDNLKNELDESIGKMRNGDPSHSRSPNALKYLRNRIATSIEIYQKYAIKI